MIRAGVIDIRAEILERGGGRRSRQIPRPLVPRLNC
jgi:hypothetical protein